MRAFNWVSRPDVAASVIVPNCGVLTNRFGVPRFVWFNGVKSSTKPLKGIPIHASSLASPAFSQKQQRQVVVHQAPVDEPGLRLHREAGIGSRRIGRGEIEGEAHGNGCDRDA
jgi:hypothetical protein